ncbi:MAG: NADH-quinone oxidoreductase subunit K [Gammaproteobacteria bacterium]|nr:NADH-quinone oxidoreductase subunit K [Gammaproteobacteria bacterium]
MSLILALAIALTVAAGVYLALSRDLFRCIVGLAVLGSAVNLVVFAAGRFGPIQPPIVSAGAEKLAEHAANPLPQALVLTAIVISFALLCFSLVLGARLRQQSGSDDSNQLRNAEPLPADPVKPPVLD